MAFVVVRLTGSCHDRCDLILTPYSVFDQYGDDFGSEGPITLTFQRGDTNADGSITIADVLVGARYLAVKRETGLDSINLINLASVRHDGKFDVVTISDVLFLRQYLAGFRGADMNRV